MTAKLNGKARPRESRHSLKLVRHLQPSARGQTDNMAPSHVGSLEHAHWPRAPLLPGLHAPSGARRVWLPSVSYV